MLLVTKKNLKLLWKNFYTPTHFTQLKNTWVYYELRTVSYLITVVFWFLVPLYKYFLIVYSALITFFLYKLYLLLMYLLRAWSHFFVYTGFGLFLCYNYKLLLLLLLLYVLYCSDSFCTVFVVIYWQVLYPLWWISGILNKWLWLWLW